MPGGEPFGFVDSHAHLADPAFDADRASVLQAAWDAGCRGIVCIGETIAAAERALEIARASDGRVVSTAGVHPHEASVFDAQRDVPRLRALIERGAKALGECGLDYHYDHAPRETQRAVFAAHIALAAELRVPVVVHTREAEADTIAAIHDAERAGVIGVLHCFGGGPALAEAGLAAGWFVSFAGVVTFKKWTGDDLIRMVPDDRILAESDSPYLTPAPFRGKRNEPSYVAHTVRRLAAARDDDPARVGALTTANASRCFTLVTTAKGA